MAQNNKNTQKEISKPSTSLAPLWQFLSFVQNKPVHFILLFLALSEQVRALNGHRELPAKFDFSGIDQSFQIYNSMLQETNITVLRTQFKEYAQQNNHHIVTDILDRKIAHSSEPLWHEMKIEFLTEHQLTSKLKESVKNLPPSEEYDEIRAAGTLLTLINFDNLQQTIEDTIVYFNQLSNSVTAIGCYAKAVYLINVGLLNADIKSYERGIERFKNAINKQPDSTLYRKTLDATNTHYYDLLANRPVNIFSHPRDIYVLDNISLDNFKSAIKANFSKEILKCAEKNNLPLLMNPKQNNNKIRLYIARENHYELYEGFEEQKISFVNNHTEKKLNLKKYLDKKNDIDQNFLVKHTTGILTPIGLITTELELEDYLFKPLTDHYNNLYASGNYQQALSIVKQLIEACPSTYHLELQYTLAHAMGDIALVNETLSQLKQTHSDLLHAHYIVENIGTSDPVVFKEMLARNIKINSEKITSPFVHYAKGIFLTKISLLSSRSHFAKGKFHLQEACKISSKSPLFQQGLGYADSVDLALNQTANFSTPNIYYTLYNTTTLTPTRRPSSFSKSAFELAKTHHLALILPPNTLGTSGMWRERNPSIGNFLIPQNNSFHLYNGYALNQTICLEQVLIDEHIAKSKDIPDFIKNEIYAFIDDRGNIIRSEEELNYLYADQTYDWKNIGMLLLAVGVTIINFLVYFYRNEIKLFFTTDIPQMRPPITTSNITTDEALENLTKTETKKPRKIKKKKSSPAKNTQQTEQKEIEQLEQEALLEQHVTCLNIQLNTLVDTEISLDIKRRMFIIQIEGTQNCLLAQLPSKDPESSTNIENNTPKFPPIPIDSKKFAQRLIRGSKELYKNGDIQVLKMPNTQSPITYIKITAPEKLPTLVETIGLVTGISKAFIKDFIKTNKNDESKDNNSKPAENKEEKKPASSYSDILSLEDITALKSTFKEIQDWHNENKTKIAANSQIELIGRTQKNLTKSLEELSKELDSLTENNNNIESTISYNKLKHLNNLSNAIKSGKEKLILALEKNPVAQNIVEEEINNQQQQRELFFNLHDQFLTVSAWLDTESNLVKRNKKFDHINRLFNKLCDLYDEVNKSILVENEVDRDLIDAIDLDTLLQLKKSLTTITEIKNQLSLEFKILYDQEDTKLEKFKKLTEIKTKNKIQKNKKDQEKAEEQKKKEQDELLKEKIQQAAALMQKKQKWLANVDKMFEDNRGKNLLNIYFPSINQLLWLVSDKPEQCALFPYLKQENIESLQNSIITILSNGLLYYTMRIFHALGQLLNEYNITSEITLFFTYVRNKYQLNPETSHLLLFSTTDEELKSFNAIELMYLIKNSLAYNFYYWLKNPTQLAKLGELLIIIENSLEKFKIEKENLRLDKNIINIELDNTDNIIFDFNQIHAILLDIRSSAKNEVLTKEEVAATTCQQFATLSTIGNALWSLIEKNNKIDSNTHQVQNLIDKNVLLMDAIKGCITSLDQAIKTLAQIDPDQYNELSKQLDKHGQKLLVDKINTVRNLIRHEHKLSVAQVEAQFISIYIHPTEIDSFQLQRLARDAARFYEEYYLAPPLDASNENSNNTNNSAQNTNAESTDKSVEVRRPNRSEPSPTKHIVEAMLKMKERQDKREQKAELKEIYKVTKSQ